MLQGSLSTFCCPMLQVQFAALGVHRVTVLWLCPPLCVSGVAFHITVQRAPLSCSANLKLFANDLVELLTPTLFSIHVHAIVSPCTTSVFSICVCLTCSNCIPYHETRMLSCRSPFLNSQAMQLIVGKEWWVQYKYNYSITLLADVCPASYSMVACMPLVF